MNVVLLQQFVCCRDWKSVHPCYTLEQAIKVMYYCKLHILHKFLHVHFSD